LGQGDCGGGLGHPESVARLGVDPAVARFLQTAPAVPHKTQALGDLVVIGHHAAAHVGTQGLLRIEGKPAGLRQCARQAPFVGAEHRLAGVFVDDETMSLRESVDRVHVTDDPGLVHAQDRPGAVGDGRFHRLRADIDASRRGVGEDRDEPLPEEPLNCAIVRDRADDYLIPRLEGKRRREDRQGRSAARRGHAVFHPEGLGEGALEAPHEVAREAAVHHLLQVRHRIGPHDAREGVRQPALEMGDGCGSELGTVSGHD